MSETKTEFEWLEELNEDESAEPWLVLALDGDRDYNFAPGLNWQHINHQTAGTACHHWKLHAVRLVPKDDTVRAWMRRIADHWFANGWLRVSLDELVAYRKQLREMGCDCNLSYPDFEEAIYPIDCTKEALTKLCSESLPDDLDTLVIWKNPIDKMCGMIGRWKLFILGPNSD